MIQISRITSIHQYSTDRKSWHCAAPRNVHYLSYQLKGSSLHYVNDKVLEVKTGSLLFLHKLDAYDVIKKNNEMSKCICIFFDGEIPYRSFVINNDLATEFKIIMQKLFSLKDLQNEANYYRCFSCLYEIFAIMETNKNKKYFASDNLNKIQEVVNYIELNYLLKPISNTELAKMANISTRYLMVLFKATYGMPPARYIMYKKLDKAAVLLQSGCYGVSQVSSISGFSDVYYFSKLFKKKFGVSPRKYRENALGGLPVYN